MRILVVEDEKNLNDLIVKKLKLEHYSVDACLRGDEALDYLMCTSYDAVILDIMLPGVSGLEILSRLRGCEKRRPRSPSDGAGLYRRQGSRT